MCSCWIHFISVHGCIVMCVYFLLSFFRCYFFFSFAISSIFLFYDILLAPYSNSTIYNIVHFYLSVSFFEWTRWKKKIFHGIEIILIDVVLIFLFTLLAVFKLFSYCHLTDTLFAFYFSFFLYFYLCVEFGFFIVPSNESFQSFFLFHRRWCTKDVFLPGGNTHIYLRIYKMLIASGSAKNWIKIRQCFALFSFPYTISILFFLFIFANCT